MPVPMTYREVVEDEPQDGGRFNGEGGIRRKWWWQAGPVDSCCFCCSLRAGVAILATLDLLYKGVYCALYGTRDIKKLYQNLLAQSQSSYARSCKGAYAQSEACVGLHHSIQQVIRGIDFVDSLPTIFYVQGFICIIAGLAGLFAVFRSNALAAKFYLWTWLPRFLVMMVTEYITCAKGKEFGLDQHPRAVIIAEIINTMFIAYFVKVLWSYHQRLKGHASSVSHAEESIQFRTRRDGAV